MSSTDVLETFVVRKSDSLPSLFYTVSRSGSGSTTPNLTGFDVNLKVRKVGATTNHFAVTVTSSGGTNGQITTPSCGKVRFDWTTGRWGTTGSFFGEVSFVSTAGKVETAPRTQPITVRSEF